MRTATSKLLCLGALGLVFAAAWVPGGFLTQSHAANISLRDPPYTGFKADTIRTIYVPHSPDPLNNFFYCSARGTQIILSDGGDLIGVNNSRVTWKRKAFRGPYPIVDMQAVDNRLLIADSSGKCDLCNMATGLTEETWAFPQPIRLLTSGVVFNDAYWNTSYTPPKLLKYDLRTKRIAVQAMPRDGSLSNVVTYSKMLVVSNDHTMYAVDPATMQIKKSKYIRGGSLEGRIAFLSSTDKILSRMDGLSITSYSGADWAEVSRLSCQPYGLSSPPICNLGSLVVSAGATNTSIILQWCPLDGLGWQVPYNGNTYEQSASIVNGFSVTVERNEGKEDHWYL
ncbi:MAG: hypothetical protein WCI73_13670, partial [Phycisphaerae bacterium]